MRRGWLRRLFPLGGSIRVAVLGFVGSGKTAYLYVLHQQHYLGPWKRSRFSETYREFIAAINLEDWQATKTDETRWFNLPLFSIYRRNWFLRLIKFKLTAWDQSGEIIRAAFDKTRQDYLNPQALEQAKNVKNEIARSDAVILVMSASLGDLADKQLSLKDVWLLLEGLPRESENDSEIAIPVALVITKADELGSDCKYSKHDLSPLTASNFKDRTNSALEGGTTILEQWKVVQPGGGGQSGNRQGLFKDCHRFAAFAVSNWQHVTAVGNHVVIEEPITPWNIELPIIWIADQLFERYWPALAVRWIGVLLLTSLLAAAGFFGIPRGRQWYQALQAERRPGTIVLTPSLDLPPGVPNARFNDLMMQVDDRPATPAGLRSYREEWSPGTHIVRISHPDLLSFTTNIVVRPGASNEISLPLRLRPEGSVNITASVSRIGGLAPAEFLSNIVVTVGTNTNHGLPWQLDHLPEGSYAITAVLPGFSNATAEAKIQPLRPENVNLLMDPVPATLFVETSAQVADFTIQIDAGTIAHAYQGPLQISPGRHSCVIEAKGYELYTTNLVLKPGETAKIFVGLSPRPGRVIITNAPAGTRVNGKLVFSGTTFDDIPYGSATNLTVVVPGKNPFLKTVSISYPEETVSVPVSQLPLLPEIGVLTVQMESEEPGVPVKSGQAYALANGRIIPAGTPTELAPGPYSISADPAGFQRVETNVDIGASTTNLVVLRLHPKPAVLKIENLPGFPKTYTAHVAMGKLLSEQGNRFFEFASGRLTQVDLQAAGYAPVTTNFYAAPGDSYTWKPRWEHLINRLKISNLLPDDQVDGKAIDNQTTVTLEFPSDRRMLTVEIERPGFLPLKISRQVEQPGSEQIVDLSTEKFIKPRPGAVTALLNSVFGVGNPAPPEPQP